MENQFLETARHKGEGIYRLQEDGKSFTLFNSETGRTRQFVSKYGQLLLDDCDFNLEAMKMGCPHFRANDKVARYGFGLYSEFRNGVCALSWTVYPDGCYFRDSDGFGGDDNDEEDAYCVINRNLDIILPFQPMKDVRAVLELCAMNIR